MGEGGAMPIVSEAARGADSGSSGFGRRGGWSPSSSTMVPGSDSRAAVLQCDEMEESDGEVQSSYRGPFETMEALQDALPSNRSVSPIRGFVNLSSSGNPYSCWILGLLRILQGLCSLFFYFLGHVVHCR